MPKGANHPSRGSIITVEDPKDIEIIWRLLNSRPRDCSSTTTGYKILMMVLHLGSRSSLRRVEFKYESQKAY